MSQYSLGAGLVTYLPRLRSGAKRLVLRVYLVGAAISAVLATAYVVIAPRVSPALHDLATGPLAVGFVAAVIVWTIFGLQDNALIGLRQAVWVPIENIAYSAAKLLMVAVMVGSLPRHWIFASWTAPAAVGVIPVSFVLFGRLLGDGRGGRGYDDRPRLSFSRFVLADGLGMTLAQFGVTALLPLMIITRLGGTEAAQFYIAWVVAQSFDLLASNIGLSLTVEGASTGDPRSLLPRLMWHLVGIVAVLSGIAALIAPEAMRLFGSTYDESASIFRLLLIASVLKVISILALATFRAELAARKLVVLLTVPSVVMLAGAWFLMPVLGVEGPAVSLIGSQVISLGLALWLLGWLKRGRAR